MKRLLKLARTVALVLICCMIVSLPASASDELFGSKAKFNVTYKGKTVTFMNKGYSTFTINSLKKKWGTPKTSTTNGRKTYTFKAGKSKIEIIPWSTGKGNSVVITATDKNIKINGVYVGMTKTAALKSLKKSFGKSYVKLSTSSNNSKLKCIAVQYGGLMPIEFQYNSKGKITKIYFFCS